MSVCSTKQREDRFHLAKNAGKQDSKTANSKYDDTYADDIESSCIWEMVGLGRTILYRLDFIVQAIQRPRIIGA
jgi:hypothetical protein